VSLRTGVAVLVVLCCTVISQAQAPTAVVNGQVRDTSGAAIPKATVVVINDATNVRSTTETNDEGIYSVPNLLPGTYHIQVSKTGFKTIVHPDIVLNLQDAKAIGFTLPVGPMSDTVTVEGGVSLINTESAAVSTVVDQAYVSNMPLNGRSIQDLISMTPGVVTQSPNTSTGVGFSGDFSVNGQRTESNIYTVDGVSGNVAAGAGFGVQNNAPAATGGSIASSTVLGTTQSLISVDALQEFRVQSSTYSAEYGRGPGGQFSLVTRSGTNDFHGTLFDYLRNDFFDANDWFNNSLGQPISALRQNDFGGTLGGPVLIPGLYHGKDKTFLFVSYEGLRLTQPKAASTSNLVPDTFMRQQAPAALQPILNAFPIQSGIDHGTAAAPSLAQFIKSYSVPSQIDSTSVRLDHTFSPKLSLLFRFGDTPSSTQIRGLGGASSVLTRTNVNTRTYTLGATSQLSSKANNEFRVGYARSDSSLNGTLDTFGGATPVDLAPAMGTGSSLTAQLLFAIVVPGTGASALRLNSGTSNQLRQWNVNDTFSLVLGRHQLKAGMDYRRILSPGTPGSPSGSAIYRGAQSVLDNSALPLELVKSLVTRPVFNETTAFFQDQCHVAPRLVLSLGLRWEIDPPPHGADSKDAYTVLGSINNPSSLTLAPQGTPLWKTSWYNFAPRLGFAWTARNSSGWETIVRAGGGVYFDTNNQVASNGFSALGFTAVRDFFGVPLPATPAQLNFSPSVSVPYDTVYAFPAHLQLPYTLQYNLSVQQAMGKSQALTLSYVGANGRRLMGQLQLTLDQLNPNPNPNFKTVLYISNLTSDYHALQAQFQRSVTRGVHAVASYTWSHCLDFGSSYSSLPATRGNCDFDIRHNLEGGASWDLPSVHGNRVVESLANHWGLDGRLIARTAFPVPLQGASFLIDPATGSQFASNLNLVPGQPVYLHGAQYPGGRAINPNAFCDPTAGPCPGSTAPRNLVYGFGAWQVNFAVRREFPIHERLKLQFRAEAFNIFNHPNFGRIDPNYCSLDPNSPSFSSPCTFGQALSMLNQSLGSVAPQYQQGGPRSMQFALKLLF
jgi:carboxypeptidase family protein